MSTTRIDTWAVDLADVTVIYPFVGFEGLMVVIAVAAWLSWHIWHAKWEGKEYQAEIDKYGDQEAIRRAIETTADPRN